MKKCITEKSSSFEYSHVEIVENRPVFSVIISFGPNGRPHNFYTVNDVPAEVKSLIDSYFRTMKITDSFKQHELSVYNTWLEKFYPNEHGREIEIEIIEHTLKIDRQIFDCGHTVDTETWVCDSPFAGWGNGEIPTGPYKHDYIRDNPTIIDRRINGDCPTCKDIAEAKTKTPILLVTSDEWSRDPYVVFEGDKIIGEFIPAEWIDNKYYEAIGCGEQISRKQIEQSMYDDFFSENSDIDEFWADCQILRVGDEYYKYYNDGTVTSIDSDNNEEIPVK